MGGKREWRLKKSPEKCVGAVVLTFRLKCCILVFFGVAGFGSGFGHAVAFVDNRAVVESVLMVYFFAVRPLSAQGAGLRNFWCWAFMSQYQGFCSPAWKGL